MPPRPSRRPRTQRASGDFIRNTVVAEGLPDRDYAPLLASIEPSFLDVGLSALRPDVDAGYLTLGPFTETVQEAAGDTSAVYITSCSDYRERTCYLAADGTEVADQDVGLLTVLVTMVKPLDTWLIADYNRAEDVPCL